MLKLKVGSGEPRLQSTLTTKVVLNGAAAISVGGLESMNNEAVNVNTGQALEASTWGVSIRRSPADSNTQCYGGLIPRRAAVAPVTIGESE